jgi:hypothetical protein
MLDDQDSQISSQHEQVYKLIEYGHILWTLSNNLLVYHKIFWCSASHIVVKGSDPSKTFPSFDPSEGETLNWSEQSKSLHVGFCAIVILH